MTAKKKSKRRQLEDAVQEYYSYMLGPDYRSDGWVLYIAGENMNGDGTETEYVQAEQYHQPSHVSEGLASRLLRQYDD